MMTSTNDLENEMLRFIEHSVDMYWSKHKTVCYLSALGVELKKIIPQSDKVLSKGLVEFLRQNPVVQIVQFPGILQKIGAVPISVKLPEDVKTLFARDAQTTVARSEPAYDQEFWDAFIKPIDTLQRFVCLNDKGGVHVSDREANVDSSKCYEILASDLNANTRGNTIAERVSATHEAISAWLTKHSLSCEQFAPKRQFERESKIEGRLFEFFNAFGGLTSEELARIKIPMDILLKLNSKR